LDQPTFTGSKKYIFLDSEVVRNQLTEMRVVKQPIEIDIMSFVNDVSSEALITVMQSAKDLGSCEEFQAEALFKFECFKRGCRRVGYGCIACSGQRNAILHYGHPAFPNDHICKVDEMRLLDMGGEYHG